MVAMTRREWVPRVRGFSGFGGFGGLAEAMANQEVNLANAVAANAAINAIPADPTISSLAASSDTALSNAKSAMQLAKSYDMKQSAFILSVYQSIENALAAVSSQSLMVQGYLDQARAWALQVARKEAASVKAAEDEAAKARLAQQAALDAAKKLAADQDAALQAQVDSARRAGQLQLALAQESRDRAAGEADLRAAQEELAAAQAAMAAAQVGAGQVDVNVDVARSGPDAIPDSVLDAGSSDIPAVSADDSKNLIYVAIGIGALLLLSR